MANGMSSKHYIDRIVHEEGGNLPYAVISVDGHVECIEVRADSLQGVTAKAIKVIEGLNA